jgi:hypothetical protein
MDWLELFEKASIICIFSAFVICLLVGWAHGGKYNMSPFDPANYNKISPLGMKLFVLAGGLILLAILLAGIVIWASP